MADAVMAGSEQPLNSVADAMAAAKLDLAKLLMEPSAETEHQETAPGDAPEAEAPAAETPAEESVDIPEPEDAEAAAEEPEAEAEGFEADDLRLTPEQRKALGEKFAKRIGKAKLTYAKQAEEAVAAAKAEAEALRLEQAQLQAKLAEAEAKASTQAPASPALPWKQTLDQAQAVKAQAEELLDALQDDPDYVARELQTLGVKLTNAEGEEDFSRPTMRRALRQAVTRATADAERATTERQRFEQAENSAKAEAMKLLPGLRDPKSEDVRLFHRVLQVAPELRSRPTWAEDAAIFVLGLKAKQQLAGVAKGERKAPPTLAAGKAAVTRAASGAEGHPEDRKRAFLDGDVEARRRLVSTLLG